MPEELKFFYGDFLIKLKLLGLTQENERFLDLLRSHNCANIMRENRLTIHVET